MSTPDGDQKNFNSISQHLAVLIPGLCILVICHIWFAYARYQFPSFFQRRTTQTSAASEKKAPKDLGYFGAWKMVLLASDEEIIDYCGFDGWIYIQLQEIWVEACTVLSVLGCVMLVPIYKDGEVGLKHYEKYSLSNLKNDVPELWAPFAFTWVGMLVVLYILEKNMDNIARLARAYKLKAYGREYTVMVQDIPEDFRFTNAVRRYVEGVYTGEKVFSVQMVDQLADLRSLVSTYRNYFKNEAVARKKQREDKKHRAPTKRVWGLTQRDIDELEALEKADAAKADAAAAAEAARKAVPASPSFHTPQPMSPPEGKHRWSAEETKMEPKAVQSLGRLHVEEEIRKIKAKRLKEQREKEMKKKLKEKKLREKKLKKLREREMRKKKKLQEKEKNKKQKLYKVEEEEKKLHEKEMENEVEKKKLKREAMFQSVGDLQGKSEVDLEMMGAEKQQRKDEQEETRKDEEKKEEEWKEEEKKGKVEEAEEEEEGEGKDEEQQQLTDKEEDNYDKDREKARRVYETRIVKRFALVETANYYKMLRNRVMHDIIEERSKTHTKAPVAFVTFTALRDAAMAAQTRLLPSDGFTTTMAPQPRDVYWKNLETVTPELKEARQCTLTSMSIMLIIFWTIPTALVLALSRISLYEDWPVIKQIFEAFPALKPLVAGLLPVVALSALQSNLPLIYHIMASYSGLLTKSEMTMWTYRKFWLHSVIHVFIIYTVGGAVITIIAEVIQNPLSVFTLLGNAIPAQAFFFINYVTLEWTNRVSMKLASFSTFGLGVFYASIASTERDKDAAFDPGPVDYKYDWASDLLVWTLCICYAGIQPMVMLMGMVYFAHNYIVNVQRLIFMMGIEFETAGSFVNSVYTRTCASMILGQVTIIGVLLSKLGFLQAILLLPCLVITGQYISYHRKKYKMLLEMQIMPLVSASQIDQERHSEKVADLLTLRHRCQVWQAPSMSSSLVHPLRYDVGEVPPVPVFVDEEIRFDEESPGAVRRSMKFGFDLDELKERDDDDNGDDGDDDDNKNNGDNNKNNEDNEDDDNEANNKTNESPEAGADTQAADADSDTDADTEPTQQSKALAAAGIIVAGAETVDGKEEKKKAKQKQDDETEMVPLWCEDNWFNDSKDGTVRTLTLNDVTISSKKASQSMRSRSLKPHPLLRHPKRRNLFQGRREDLDVTLRIADVPELLRHEIGDADNEEAEMTVTTATMKRLIELANMSVFIIMIIDLHSHHLVIHHPFIVFIVNRPRYHHHHTNIHYTHHRPLPIVYHRHQHYHTLL